MVDERSWAYPDMYIIRELSTVVTVKSITHDEMKTSKKYTSVLCNSNSSLLSFSPGRLVYRLNGLMIALCWCFGFGVGAT